MTLTRLSLFGGVAPWHASDWTASDDRVRGGSSQSYLDIVPLSTCTPQPGVPQPGVKRAQARFYGTLDTSTLGGAGFASQRTTSTDTTWDLAAYAGIELTLRTTPPAASTGVAAAKKYTFILKDSLLDKDPDTGREQATVSWEVDFTVPHTRPASSAPDSVGDQKSSRADPTVLRIPWADFKPTYRGRAKKNAGKLDTGGVKRFSFMMRSFFDEQQGPFELFVEQVAAYKEAKEDKGPGGLFASLGRCLGWRL